MKLLYIFLISFFLISITLLGDIIVTIPDNTCESGNADISRGSLITSSFPLRDDAKNCALLSSQWSLTSSNGRYFCINVSNNILQVIYVPEDNHSWYSVIKSCSPIPPPCVPAPPIPERSLVETFPPLNSMTADSDSCNNAVLNGIYEKNGQNYNNLECWSNSCEHEPRTWYLYGDIFSTLPDADGDGSPDKCDEDFVDYQSLDCDGDGTPNVSDSDPNDPGASGSCPPIPSGYITTSNLEHVQCYTGHPLTITPDGYVYYLDPVTWDNCRDICTAFKAFCPRGQNILSGKCVYPKPDYTKCEGTVEEGPVQYQISSPNERPDGAINGCFKDYVCRDGSNNGDGYILKSIAVSCIEEKEPEDDYERPSDFDYSTNTDDPLYDYNGTFDEYSAESVKSALESYGVSTEKTQNEIGKELEDQTKLLDEQKDIQDDISRKLDQQNDLQLTTNSKLNSLSKESTQKEILSKLDGILTAMNGIRSDLNGTSSTPGTDDTNDSGDGTSNDSIDDNTTYSNGQLPTDDNSTNDDNTSGWSKDDFEEQIRGVYDTQYQLFTTECGSPSFDPSISFMGYVTVDNPLPIMHEHIHEYFPIIKNIVTLAATLVGLLTVFRR